LTTVEDETWMTPIRMFLKMGECKEADEKVMKKKCSRFIIISH